MTKKILIRKKKEIKRIMGDRSLRKKVGSLVSITDPGDAKIHVPDSDRYPIEIHRMSFEDVEEEFKGKLHVRREDIQKMIDAAPKLLDTDKEIICHCQAGISRSAAAAVILACIDLGGKGNEEDALFAPKSPRLQSPNRLMLEFADDILGTDLAGTLDEWQERKKRGEECFSP